MLTAIVRFFGWDKAPPVRPPAKVKARPSQAAGGGVRPGSGPVGAPRPAATAHDKSKAQAGGGDAKPAVAVIPGDVDQRMPQVASPGLPPVDPVGQEAEKVGASAMMQDGGFPAPCEVGQGVPGRDSIGASASSSPGFDRSGADQTGSMPGPIRPSSAPNHSAPRQGDAGEASKSLEIADSSIERSFVDVVPAQGPSKDRPDDLKDWPDYLQEVADELLQLELFPGLPVLSEHSMDVGYDDGKAFQFKDRKDWERSLRTADPACEPVEAADHTLGFDMPIETGLPRVTTPARPFPKRPQRVADRPRSEEWNDDELLTLPEAAALYWPTGPITTNTLRTAGRDGTLAITKVAGKFFTTPMAIRRMGLDGGDVPSSSRAAEIEAPASPQSVLDKKLAEARGPGRKRSRRGGARS